MKHVILRTEGDDEGILDNCSYAVICAEELATYLKGRMDMVRKFKTNPKAQNLWSMTFSDAWYPRFIGSEDAEKLFGDEVLQKADQGYVVVAETDGNLEDAKSERMDTIVLEVGVDWAFWSANARHCSFDVSTSRVRADDVESIRNATK